MRLSVRSLATLAVLGLAGTIPCSALADEPPAHNVNTPAPAPHGFVQMIGEALSEVNLTTDQVDMVQKIGAKLQPLQMEVDKSEATLLHALAKQVENGMIDRHALDNEIKAYVDARQQMSGPVRDAIQMLHDKLNADQRNDFADALEANIHMSTREITSGAKLHAFATKMGLSDKQITELKDALQKVKPALKNEHHDLHAAIEGFREDNFSLDRYLPRGNTEAKAMKKADLIIDITQAVMSVMTKDQLPRLAAAIEDVAHAKEGTTEKTPVQHPGAKPKGFGWNGMASYPLLGAADVDL